MKVLAVCVPQAGHVNALAPLLSALVAAGDQVLVATGAEAEATVVGTGARYHRSGQGFGSWWTQLAARTRGSPGDGLPTTRIHHYFVPRLFGEVGAADMLDDALEAGRALEPDLVLYDTMAFAGPLVARLLGAPGVLHTYGPLLPDAVLALVGDALSPLWRSMGVDIPAHAGVYGEATVSICPPSLEAHPLPGGEQILLRPVSPAEPTRPAGRPLVYVTLGTFSNSETSVFRAALDGLADEPLDVIVTVGTNNDPADLAPIPANARVERFVPQAELLPRCTAVVHHAGAGTMFGALAHGLPAVAIPQGADNFTGAQALRAAGTARVLLPGEVTAHAVRDAVRTVVEDPSYGEAARRTAGEIAAMPGPEEVAATLRSRFAPIG